MSLGSCQHSYLQTVAGLKCCLARGEIVDNPMEDPRPRLETHERPYDDLDLSFKAATRLIILLPGGKGGPFFAL